MRPERHANLAGFFINGEELSIRTAQRVCHVSGAGFSRNRGLDSCAGPGVFSHFQRYGVINEYRARVRQDLADNDELRVLVGALAVRIPGADAEVVAGVCG